MAERMEKDFSQEASLPRISLCEHWVAVWYESMMWVYDMSIWNENMKLEYDMRMWYEYMIWEYDMRIWYEYMACTDGTAHGERLEARGK